MKIFRNKLLIGLLCILIGILVAFFAIPGAVNRETETAEIYVAAAEIEAGTYITDAHLKKVEVPASLAPSDKLDPAQAVGKRAASVIYAGDALTSGKVTDTYIPLDTYSIATDKGKLVMSISAKNLSSSAAARIQPGDVVSVLALPLSTGSQSSSNDTNLTPIEKEKTAQSETETAEQETDEEQSENKSSIDEEKKSTSPVEPEKEQLPLITEKPKTVLYPELQYLEVAAVVASSGANATVKEELDEEDANELPTTISFYVNLDQALRLAELERNSNAYIVFVARGSKAYEFIPKEEKVLVLDDIVY